MKIKNGMRPAGLTANALAKSLEKDRKRRLADASDARLDLEEAK